MPLKNLSLNQTAVADLSPLAGMPILDLDCAYTKVTDLTPLLGMRLQHITFTPKNITRGMDVLRSMKTLTQIGDDRTFLVSAPDFWKRYDAGEFK